MDGRQDCDGYFRSSVGYSLAGSTGAVRYQPWGLDKTGRNNGIRYTGGFPGCGRILQCVILSEGAFDITVTPLVRLWAFGRTPARDDLPPEAAVQEQLRSVDYHRLVLKDQTAFLPAKGMALDLGGVAKGYAVDRAFEFCRSAGIEDFLIDLNGHIRGYGKPHWRETWQIGVRDPFDRSRILGKVTLRNGMALATSGNYERCVELSGQRHAHIINPRTGYPVTGTAGVTILADDDTTADGLSTSYSVVGLKGAGKLLQRAPSVEVLIVPDEYPTEIWLTPGFSRVFVPIPELSKAVRPLCPAPPKPCCSY